MMTKKKMVRALSTFAFLGFVNCLLFLGVLLSYGSNEAVVRWQELNQTSEKYNRFLLPKVNSAISCLRRINAKNYQVTSELIKDWQFYQRISEGAWPITIKEKSDWIVSTSMQVPCYYFKILCFEGGIIVGSCSL